MFEIISIVAFFTAAVALGGTFYLRKVKNAYIVALKEQHALDLKVLQGEIGKLKSDLTKAEKDREKVQENYDSFRQDLPSVSVMKSVIKKMDVLMTLGSLTEREARALKELLDQLTFYQTSIIPAAPPTREEGEVEKTEISDPKKAKSKPTAADIENIQGNVFDNIDRNFNPATGKYDNQKNRGKVGWGSDKAPPDPNSSDTREVVEGMDVSKPLKSGDVDKNIDPNIGFHVTEFESEEAEDGEQEI